MKSGAPILSHWGIFIGRVYTIGFNKKNGNFEKSQELKDRTEK
jgi:hypothetical protein